MSHHPPPKVCWGRWPLTGFSALLVGVSCVQRHPCSYRLLSYFPAKPFTYSLCSTLFGSCPTHKAHPYRSMGYWRLIASLCDMSCPSVLIRSGHWFVNAHNQAFACSMQDSISLRNSNKFSVPGFGAQWFLFLGKKFSQIHTYPGLSTFRRGVLVTLSFQLVGSTYSE